MNNQTSHLDPTGSFHGSSQALSAVQIHIWVDNTQIIVRISIKGLTEECKHKLLEAVAIYLYRNYSHTPNTGLSTDGGEYLVYFPNSDIGLQVAHGLTALKSQFF